MAQRITIFTDYNAYVGSDVLLPAGRTWDDVAEWGVKWRMLRIIWRDGTETEHELEAPDPDMIDTKRPTQVSIETADEPHTLLDES
jgi:hypothetical protein